MISAPDVATERANEDADSFRYEFVVVKSLLVVDDVRSDALSRDRLSERNRELMPIGGLR